ncbi:unnamed protein product, partial [Prorocentrum cordatum]
RRRPRRGGHGEACGGGGQGGLAGAAAAEPRLRPRRAHGGAERRPRSSFLTGAARRALQGLPRGRRAVAVVVDGCGWEAVWLARRAAALGLCGVCAVRARASALAGLEGALAEANGCCVQQCLWEGLGAHLEAAAPTAVLVLLCGCLAAHPASPGTLVSQLAQVKKELPPGAAAAVVPARVRWRGGHARCRALRDAGVVDTEGLAAYGLDYGLAAEALRVHHRWVQLSECGAEWEDHELATMDLQEAWAALPGELCGSGAGPALESALRVHASTPRLWRCPRRGARPTPSSGGRWPRAPRRPTVSPVTLRPAARTQRPSVRARQVPAASGGRGRWPSSTRRRAGGPSRRCCARRRPARRCPVPRRHVERRCADGVLRRCNPPRAPRLPRAEPVVALDVGSGTGLLSLLLARRAEGLSLPPPRVVAVEAEPELAELAERLVAAHGCGDRVEVHCALSTALEGLPGAGRAGLCVHEIFGSDPLSERLLPSLRHAQRELLAPGALLVPDSFTLLCALCSSRRLAGAFRPPASVQGVRHVGEVFQDAAPIVEAMHLSEEGAEAAADPRWLTEPAVARVCALAELLGAALPLEAAVRLRGPGAPSAELAGEALFVAFWFRLEGPPELDTRSGAGPSRPWAPCFQALRGCSAEAFAQPFVAELSLRLWEDRVRFALAGVALEEEAEAAELGALFSDSEEGD